MSLSADGRPGISRGRMRVDKGLIIYRMRVVVAVGAQ